MKCFICVSRTVALAAAKGGGRGAVGTAARK